MTSPAPALPEEDNVFKLGQAEIGMQGIICGYDTAHLSDAADINPRELTRRLLEIGFVEGAFVEILHQGLIKKDPIGVRLDDMMVALRRKDANAILVKATQKYKQKTG